MPQSRRAFLRDAAFSAAALLAPPWVRLLSPDDRARLAGWLRTLRAEGLARAAVPLGRAAARVGELAA
ncbi:MAG TPA: hypothetical protein VFX98_13925, partial [Longimicrobiaceae bacterium]|nr:hypothetical protein [Longimicrobiaceae bacterium]